MSGVSGSESGLVQRLRDLLPQLGLDSEHLLEVHGERPQHLQESNLQAWSYAPEFTPLVQYLLQLRRGGRCLSIAVCGSDAASTASAYAAVQLAVGFSQHGLRSVVVDADVAQPGLAGLIADPHQEGLVDMVRFGRSCRALLRTPVPGGPALLGIGSFPIDGPAPFAPDAWLGIVHRVSVHAEVALFVAPLHVDGDVNPLAQATDQMLYVPAAIPTGTTEREFERLRRSAVRVAAVVLCAPAAGPGAVDLRAAAAARPPGSDVPIAPAAALPALPEEPVVPAPTPLEVPVAPASVDRPLPEAEAFRDLVHEAEGLPGSVDEALPRAADPGVRPPVTPVEEFELPAISEMDLEPPHPAPSSPAPFRIEAPEAPPARLSRDFPAPPAWGEEPSAPPAPVVTPSPVAAVPAYEPEPVEVGVPGTDIEAAEGRQSAARSSEEAIQLRQRLHLDDADFSYSEGGRHSRLPLFVFIAIVVTIGGFLGWALWSQREINRRAQQILSEPVEPQQSGRAPAGAPGRDQTASQQPNDVAASQPPAGATPDDQAAARGAAPPVTPAQEPTAGPARPTQDAGTVTTEPVATPTPPPPTVAEPAPPSVSPPADKPAAGPERLGQAEPAMTYAVHVASYRRLEQAHQDIANLRKHGFEGRAVRTDLGSKGIWYRVYVGSYDTKEAASAARDVIVKLPGYDAFAQVRRIAVP